MACFGGEYDIDYREDWELSEDEKELAYQNDLRTRKQQDLAFQRGLARGEYDYILGLLFGDD